MEQQKSSAYRDMVREAEEAVAVVNDPELRRLTFDRVLSHLLEERRSSDRLGARRSRKAGSGGGMKARAGGPLGCVEELLADGFFASPRAIADVRTELARRGHQIPVTSLSGPLQKLCQGKLLRRQKARLGGKRSFTYLNY